MGYHVCSGSVSLGLHSLYLLNTACFSIHVQKYHNHMTLTREMGKMFTHFQKIFRDTSTLASIRTDD